MAQYEVAPAETELKMDVCIFGAGPAGIAVASRLVEKGRAILLLECAPRKKRWGGESFTGAIRAPLLAIGCWEAFQKAGHVQGFERESRWGGDPHAETSMLHPFGPLWHVDRDRFDDDLRSEVLQRGDILRTYRKLDSVIRSADGWRITLDGNTEVTARYLVDATGRSRVLARRLHADVTFHDRLLGFTASVPGDSSPNTVRAMRIEATPFGWWYAAPTPQGHVLAAFTDGDLAPPDLKRRFTPVAANSAFTHVESAAAWLPVGDACASHDPLCGWGVHRAMTNGLRAADAINEFLQNGASTQIDDYRHHCYTEYTRYLKGLRERYSIERRWPAAPFWERRHNLVFA